jgi:hypothetical protein
VADVSVQPGAFDSRWTTRAAVRNNDTQTAVVALTPEGGSCSFECPSTDVSPQTIKTITVPVGS